MSAAAIISPSRAPMTASGTRSKSCACATLRVFAAYYGNAVIALVSEAWLGPSYQITSQLNVVNPGGAAQSRAPRLSSRFPVGSGDRALSRPRPASLAGADAARRNRSLRHADRDRADALSAVLAKLPARLHGDGAAGVSRLFRQASCPAAARQGRRGVLQPRPLPRRGNEPLEGRAPHRQSVAGFLGLRPRDGERRSAQDELPALSGAQRSPRGSARSRRARPTMPSPHVRKAIPSRPISIAIRRKAAWRRRPSRT